MVQKTGNVISVITSKNSNTYILPFTLFACPLVASRLDKSLVLQYSYSCTIATDLSNKSCVCRLFYMSTLYMVLLSMLYRDLVGMRSPIVTLRGGKLPAIPTTEPWDGKDGQVSTLHCYCCCCYCSSSTHSFLI